MTADDRRARLLKVDRTSFAATEAALFLDTHPGSRVALARYNQLAAMRREAMDAYTARYGPLTLDDATDSCHWSWAATPWPWEKEANG